MIGLKLINQMNQSLCKNGLLHVSRTVSNTPKTLQVRLFSLSGKQTAQARRRTVKTVISDSVGPTGTFTRLKLPKVCYRIVIEFTNAYFLLLAFSIGRGAVAGGAACGLGALCYYGLGLSSEVGTIETSR